MFWLLCLAILFLSQMLSAAPTVAEARRIVEERHRQCFAERDHFASEHPDELLSDLLEDLKKATGLAAVAGFGAAAVGLTKGLRWVGHSTAGQSLTWMHETSHSTARIVHNLGHSIGEGCVGCLENAQRVLIVSSPPVVVPSSSGTARPRRGPVHRSGSRGSSSSSSSSSAPRPIDFASQNVDATLVISEGDQRNNEAEISASASNGHGPSNERGFEATYFVEEKNDEADAMISAEAARLPPENTNDDDDDDDDAQDC